MTATAALGWALAAHAGLPWDEIIAPDAVQAYKPARAVYELATAAFDVRPREVLFVSANGFDVAGGCHFGFTVAWLNRGGLPPDRLDQQPHLEARGLDQVADALGA